MGCGHHGAWLHLQPGQLVPLASAAVSRVIPSEKLRWISFGHLEQAYTDRLGRLRSGSPGAALPTGLPLTGWGSPAGLGRGEQSRDDGVRS